MSILALLAGFSKAAAADQRQQFESEAQRRQNMMNFYLKLAERSDLDPQSVPLLMQRVMGLAQTPLHKKLPKELESITDIASLPATSFERPDPFTGRTETMEIPRPPPPQGMIGFRAPQEMQAEQLEMAKRQMTELGPLQAKQAGAKVKAEEEAKQPFLLERMKAGIGAGVTGIAGTIRGSDLRGLLDSQDEPASGPAINDNSIYRMVRDKRGRVTAYYPSTSSPSYWAGENVIAESAYADSLGKPVEALTDQERIESRAWMASQTGRMPVVRQTQWVQDPVSGEWTQVPTDYVPRTTVTAPRGTSLPAPPARGAAPRSPQGVPGPQAKAVDLLADEVRKRGAEVLNTYTKAQRIAVLDKLRKEGDLLATGKQKQNVIELGNVYDNLRKMREYVEKIKRPGVSPAEVAKFAFILHGLRQGLGRVMVRKVFLEVGNLSQSDVNAGLALLPGSPSAILWKDLAMERLDVIEGIVRRMQTGYLGSIKGGLKATPTGEVQGPGVIPKIPSPEVEGGSQAMRELLDMMRKRE